MSKDEAMTEDMVFSKTAQYYDRIYAHKDYAGEADQLRKLIQERRAKQPLALLDVACGTGLHIEHLKAYFDVQGLDICEELLEIARKRNPEVTFHIGDMTNFDIGSGFDVVTCLFSAIGYVRTLPRLRLAIRSMTQHLEPEGLIIIEPWLTPENWHSNTVHSLFIDDPELKIARVNTSFTKGKLSVFDLHHLIGTPEGTEHVVEHHELGLFETEEMVSVMEEEGLTVEYDHEGLTGRGLFLGSREFGSREFGRRY
jgi:ubiquinone/menaquinone biosynthesis C-methylase UbiE